MIRAFVSVLVLVVSSAAFAGENCEQLKLSCTSVFRAFDGAAEVVKSEVSTFGDEHWDEPSLANCAATAYMKLDNTSVRVYVNKDLDSDLMAFSATASQVEHKTINGEGVTVAEYSNTTAAYASIGMIQFVGSLSLPKPAMVGSSMAKEVYVSCQTK